MYIHVYIYRDMCVFALRKHAQASASRLENKRTLHNNNSLLLFGLF